MATKPRPARWRRITGHPLFHLAAALIVLAVVQSFFVKAYQVPSSSMEQTLLPGDRLLVNRLAYSGSAPAVGDIVVFERPDNWSATKSDRSTVRVMVGWFGDIFGFGPSNSDALVKRIIAGPGQTVSCCDKEGRLLRDGEPVEETYLGSNLPFQPDVLDCTTSPVSARCFPSLTVPADHYLVLGDNRANSSDGISPCRGTVLGDGLACARLVPREDIVGHAFFIVLPFSRWGAPG